MPRMKVMIPEMDSAPKAGQKREITCNYWTTFCKSCILTMIITGHFFYFDMVFEGHIIRVVRSPMLTIRQLRSLVINHTKNTIFFAMAAILFLL